MKKSLLFMMIASCLTCSTVLSQNQFPTPTGDAVIDGYRLYFPSTTTFSGSSPCSIWKDYYYGLTLRSSAGSVNNFVLFDPSGNGIISSPVGTLNTAFGGHAALNSTNKLYLDGGSNTYISEVASDAINFVTGGTEQMRIDANGTVCIGTTGPWSDYKLAVNGWMIATKVKVESYSNWPDFVFEKKYHLMSLKELEGYINKNNHLPDVPTASEVERNGLDLADNQAILLKKIEELTLYIINQQKDIDGLKKKVQDLKQRNTRR